MSRYMREKDIEAMLVTLENGDISKDEDDIGDENDIDYYSNVHELLYELDSEHDEENLTEEDPPLLIEEEGVSNRVQSPEPAAELSSGQSLSVSIGIAEWRSRSRELIWKINLEWNDERVKFLGLTELPEGIAQLDTPFQFFSQFMNGNVLAKIVDETNLYIIQNSNSTCPPVNINEIRQFLGILIFMSVFHYPSVRSYWGKYGFQNIMQTMTVNRFEKLRSVIHLNDNLQHHLQDDVGDCHPQHDRLHKIRPLIQHLNKCFTSAALFEQRLSLDEQMCSTKVARFMKQYLSNKPHKWGFKLCVLCSLSGYAYTFEIYSGKQNEEIFPGAPDLGVIGNTVIRLCRSVPRMQNHIIYFYNFYISVPLLYYLKKQGIYALGTIQRNRLGKNCELPTVKDFMKESVTRGSYEEQGADYDGVDITVTCWKDNKVVTLASTYAGSEPASTVPRYDKKQKRKIDIPCPKIIKAYSAHMGGVDLMDSFLGRYKIRIKSRKWYIRLFYHMIDMAVTNSWVLYTKKESKHDIG